MTRAIVSHSVQGRGRRGATKFTPQAIEKIKELVAQGVSRDEIANLLDVTVNSLQVTCSKLGISLRRNQNGSSHHTFDARGRTSPGSIGIVDLQEHKTEKASQVEAHDAPLPKYALTMSCQGEVRASDIPLTSREIQRLALEAALRDTGIAQLGGQILVAAIEKDIIEEILRDEVPPSGG